MEQKLNRKIKLKQISHQNSEMKMYLWVGENLVCKVWSLAQDVEPDQEAGSEGVSQLQEGHLVLPDPLAVQADDGASQGALVGLRVVIGDQVDLGLTAVHDAPVFKIIK